VNKILFLIIFGFLLLFSNSQVFAEIIQSFDVEITAHEDGSMSVMESIIYDFEGLNRHGIFRNIPLYSRVGDLYRIIKIEDIKVQRNSKREEFSKSTDSREVSLKIGDPDKTITGIQSYTINYQVINGIGSNFPDYDEIYWNATGNGWDIPIMSSSLMITTDFGIKTDKYLCFTGSSGSRETNCKVTGNTITANDALVPNEGLTGVAVFPKDTFPPSFLSKTPPQNTGERILGFLIDNFIIIWLFINIILSGLIILWYQKRKNKKRFGKPSVNFEIPKDEKGEKISPALSGIIDTAALERDDVVATLFDLAIRRYVKLEEIKIKRKFMPDENDQRIIKLKDSTGLNSFEKTLYDRLFKNGLDHIYIKDIKKDFYKTFQVLEKEAFEELVRRKYFIKNPKNQRAGLLVMSVFALFTTNIVLAAVLFYLSRKLIGRTSLGDEMDFKVDGLKIFLKNMKRHHRWQAEKFYTVEEMIPYAMSLGYIDKFMEQLKVIKPDYNPEWYSGYRGNFFLTFGALNSSLSTSITTASPSSSGSGGGGFSGGGGGGGGGGSW
jgi:uncharacterized membrane protein